MDQLVICSNVTAAEMNIASTFIRLVEIHDTDDDFVREFVEAAMKRLMKRAEDSLNLVT